MLSAVSGVNFRGSEADLISSPGKYSVQPKVEDMQSDTFESKNSNKAAKAGIAAAVLLAAAAGLGFAASKGHIKLEKLPKEQLEAITGKFDKAKAYLKNFAAVVIEKCQQGYEWAAGLFAKKAPEVAEGAEKAV